MRLCNLAYLIGVLHEMKYLSQDTVSDELSSASTRSSMNGIFRARSARRKWRAVGGVRQSTVTRALKSSLQRSQLAKQKPVSSDIGHSEKWLAESVTGLLTANPSGQHSLPRSLDSSEEYERKIQTTKGEKRGESLL